jgi:hypothetical protein
MVGFDIPVHRTDSLPEPVQVGPVVDEPWCTGSRDLTPGDGDQHRCADQGCHDSANRKG